MRTSSELGTFKQKEFFACWCPGNRAELSHSGLLLRDALLSAKHDSMQTCSTYMQAVSAVGRPLSSWSAGGVLAPDYDF